MPNFKRLRDAGGTFFFTVVTADRKPILCGDLARTLLRDAFNETRSRFPFRLGATVLMPDHLHSIWQMPEEDSDYSKRWSMIKRLFAQRWIGSGGDSTSLTASHHDERRLGVWQPRFWEHMIRADEYGSIVEYIHFNPVKHGHTRCPHEWPWSTFHQWAGDGRMRADWHCGCDGDVMKPPTFPESFDQFE